MSVMLAQFLPDKLTPLTAAQAMTALRCAFEGVDGATPSVECLAIHTAQSALEAARWKSLHNFCFTNAKASATYAGLFQCYRCNEKLADGWHWYLPEGELVGGFGTPLKGGVSLPVPEGHPQTRFRAFANINAGALDHMQLVKRKWPEAWTAARGGDVVGFVHGLKARGFFTADEAPYLAGVSSLMREFLPLARDISATHVEVTTDDEICQGLACVAPDPDRYLHTEAVLAVMGYDIRQSMLDDKNAALSEEDS